MRLYNDNIIANCHKLGYMSMEKCEYKMDHVSLSNELTVDR